MDRTQTIVIVDDDREIRTLMELALAKPGRSVIGFGDGQEALDYLERADGVDLVVSDVVMEGFDGHRLLRHLRANARTAATSVIFVTAADFAEDWVGGIGDRAVEHLRKPFEIDGLRALAESAIRSTQRVGPVRDPATGLHVRDHFEALVAAALNDSLPNGPPLALMAGDLQSHDPDAALRRVAVIIGMHLRATDFAGRINDRGFATLHPACDSAGATAIAQRIIDAVSSDPQCAGATISLGLAIAAAPRDTTSGALLDAANDALADAKSAGSHGMSLRTL